MISERQCDALDAARDASKERALNPQPEYDYPEDDEMERAITAAGLATVAIPDSTPSADAVEA